ncbi:helix-turn-helix domain-containing protein [Reyranella sp.]|jgi:CRP/FNR family nitrogen fixation transcriptional regulator|uniref:helix-turn-helix domain-containing protein n=1 Tax=Reyranella sp. TaxID=1929291 RepID=UPI002F92F993
MTASAIPAVRFSAHRPPVGLLAQRALADRPLDEVSRSGARRNFTKGEELFAEGEAADFFYKVVSGTVRVCKLLSDGRRQIEAFQLAGDIFGLESGSEHRFTAEAVEDTVVLAFRRSRLASLMHDNPAFGDHVMSSMIESLERAQEHMVLLGRKTALEKMATFLLDMSGRLAQGGSVELPMQRTDIADHLGLTIETVSRTLSQMVRDGLIKLAATGRTIVISDKAALQALNG